MADENKQPKKYLTREEILKFNQPPTIHQLPSGTVIQTAFLSLFMVTEIQRNIETATEDDRERIFTQRVLEQMLRENDEKDYQTFSPEDQLRLIEIAAAEWGCEDKYDQLVSIDTPEVRFYQAVRLQEQEIALQFSNAAKAMTANLVGALKPFEKISQELASSLNIRPEVMLSAFTKELGDEAQLLNVRAMEQMGDIFQFQTPILGMLEGIKKAQLALAMPSQSTWLDSMGGTVSAYQNLMKEILPVERFAALPEAVRYYPTIEMHNAAIVTSQLLYEETAQPQADIITPDQDDLMDWLRRLDPNLPKMLLGAEETIHSSNPDHCRHFASSHRELATHVLHLLSPNNKVKQWTQDPNHFGKDGKPTRTARIKYIAKNHKNRSFTDFLVKAFENQMNLLNSDAHRITQEYTDKQLRVLHQNFLSTLGFLKEIVTSYSS